MVRNLRRGRLAWLVPGLLLTGLLQPIVAQSAAAAPQNPVSDYPVDYSKAAGFDVSPAVRSLPRTAPAGSRTYVPRERGPLVRDRGYSGDGALQAGSAPGDAVSGPIQNIEGASNADNPFLVSPPDPNGEVGPNNFVEMTNLTFSIYDKTGTVLIPPTELGALWAGFSLPDCTDNSGDPIVVYDQLADRWLLTQFTTRGPTYYNCVAISTSGDPTGTYYRYAFSTGTNFPDYPKYGVWPNAYFIATREFGAVDFFGVGAYALERSRMIAGDPNARVVHVNLPPGNTPYLPGDGLLPTDFDGTTLPPAGSPNYYVGTQDDNGPYGAPYDAINMWAFLVRWGNTPFGSFQRIAQLRVANFDSAFPCGASGRACIAQPDTNNKIDVLSYRQRPIWRLAYRNFGTYESLVTNQSVEARPGIAGVRWYEIRNPLRAPQVYQQGTFAPNDGVNRWMGSVAMDKFGNMAAGYSVSSSTVFPGVRYVGRTAGSPRGELPLGEQSLIEGSGSQTGSPRWGDYTALTVDPTDDCTFWYVNEYIQTTGSVPWQTRIGSFKFPGC